MPGSPPPSCNAPEGTLFLAASAETSRGPRWAVTMNGVAEAVRPTAYSIELICLVWSWRGTTNHRGSCRESSYEFHRRSAATHQPSATANATRRATRVGVSKGWSLAERGEWRPEWPGNRRYSQAKTSCCGFRRQARPRRWRRNTVSCRRSSRFSASSRVPRADKEHRTIATGSASRPSALHYQGLRCSVTSD